MQMFAEYYDILATILGHCLQSDATGLHYPTNPGCISIHQTQARTCCISSYITGNGIFYNRFHITIGNKEFNDRGSMMTLILLFVLCYIIMLSLPANSLIDNT